MINVVTVLNCDIQPNNYELLPGGLAGVPDGLTRLAKNDVSGVKLVARIADTSGEVGGAGLAEAVPKEIAFMRKFFPVGTLPTDV